MIESFAPVVLFTYNRISHVKLTVEALLANKWSDKTDLIVYSDAAKNENAITGVSETRAYLRTINGFNSITIIEREKNWGLASNIIDGVTKIVNQYGRVIVLEDDHVTSLYFIQYMNEALEFYKDNEKVASIHGYVYPCKDKLPYLFFIKGADCWGWATWKRAWDVFNPNGQELLNELKRRKAEKEFDFDFSYDYVRMLENQITGRNSSWAIRWCASTFLKDMYTLYPGESMVKMIGADGQGTHSSGVTNRFDVELHKGPINLSFAPIEVCTSQQGWIAYKHFFLSFYSCGEKIIRRFSSLIGKRISIYSIKSRLHYLIKGY